MASTHEAILPALAPGPQPGAFGKHWSRDSSSRRTLEPLALLRALHASLDPEIVIRTFAERLGRHFGLDGFGFRHPMLGWHCGSSSSFHCAFDLHDGGESLGRIRCYRQCAFSRAERRQIAALVELLTDPLRNALAHAELRQQAWEDGLTALPNRHALARILPREIAVATREERQLAAILLDLDHFKQINDTRGHLAGDMALRATATAIRNSVRLSDLAFRYGGEEFLILLPDTNATGAWRVAERLRDSLVARGRGGNGHAPAADGPIRFSAGITTLLPGEDGTALLARADRALYEAKAAGRNRSVILEPQSARPTAVP